MVVVVGNNPRASIAEWHNINRAQWVDAIKFNHERARRAPAPALAATTRITTTLQSFPIVRRPDSEHELDYREWEWE